MMWLPITPQQHHEVHTGPATSHRHSWPYAAAQCASTQARRHTKCNRLRIPLVRGMSAHQPGTATIKMQAGVLLARGLPYGGQALGDGTAVHVLDTCHEGRGW